MNLHKKTLVIFLSILAILCFYNFTFAQINSINNTSSLSNEILQPNTSIIKTTISPTPVKCTNLYWFDNTSTNCGYKQFCGTYMYQSLQTFATENECLSALKASIVTNINITPSTEVVNEVFPVNSAVEIYPTRETNSESIKTITSQPNIPIEQQNYEIQTITQPITSPNAQQTTTSIIEIQEKIQNTTNSLEAIQSTIETTREQLKKIVEQNVSQITSENGTPVNTKQIETIKTNIINNIDTTLNGKQPVTQEKIEILTKDIQTGLNQISDTQPPLEIQKENYSNAVEKTFETMSMSIEDQVKTLKDQGGDLLYKDSNNDGVSDYDSKYVYNIDPIKPTPTTIYDGKVINAGEKIKLGFDPTETNLVKIMPEEPTKTEVQPTTFYKVNEVKLTPEKKVEIKGKFLPNSYVTIYVYSTPIIVTVKTDSNGDWSYTLDSELESGKHTIYTATVNNTGKIIAKSPAFTFIKTAEAATLESVAPIQTTDKNARPGMFSNTNFYLLAIIFIPIIIFSLVIVGIGIKKNNSPTIEQ